MYRSMASESKTGCTCRGGYCEVFSHHVEIPEDVGRLLSHLQVVAHTLQYFPRGLSVGNLLRFPKSWRGT